MEHDAIRCSDTDRNRAQAVLRSALGRRQITLLEFDKRVQQCFVCKTRGELLEPLRDLMPNPREMLYEGAG